jgi:hypothetical protein
VISIKSQLEHAVGNGISKPWAHDVAYADESTAKPCVKEALQREAHRENVVGSVPSFEKDKPARTFCRQLAAWLRYNRHNRKRAENVDSDHVIAASLHSEPMVVITGPRADCAALHDSMKCDELLLQECLTKAQTSRLKRALIERDGCVHAGQLAVSRAKAISGLCVVRIAASQPNICMLAKEIESAGVRVGVLLTDESEFVASCTAQTSENVLQAVSRLAALQQAQP